MIDFKIIIMDITNAAPKFVSLRFASRCSQQQNLSLD